MSANGAKLFVMAAEDFACVRIVGRASFSSSIDFKTLINELLQKGCHYFVLELSQCQLMDSTFLGVLAGFGLRIRNLADGEPAIELLNPNSRINELLENLGVLHLFKVTEGTFDRLPPCEPEARTPSSPNKEEVTRACLEAHRILMSLNPENASRFKEVSQFLAEDLKKLRSGAQQSP